MLQFAIDLDYAFTLGTISQGPGRLRLYSINNVQQDDYTCRFDGDGKLAALAAYPLTLVRRQQVEESMNQIENHHFMSIDSSIGWHGITALPLCAFYASHLQQNLKESKVSALITQASKLTLALHYGTLTSFIRPACGSKAQLSLVLIADARHFESVSQLPFMIGIISGTIQQESSFHMPPRLSNK